ncbi:MAG: ShET2 enterotoxin, N-terminal region [Herminiimonas sp.]|nr:ShET2 enterotoxin, N-terminal region [Herminiimonas sp.]
MRSSRVPGDRSLASRPIEPSSTGRASATAAPGTQPPPALVGDSLAHFLRPSLSAATLAARREVIGVMEYAVQHGNTDLDFKNISPDALKAMPGAALKGLARQITGVTLPKGLDALPRCLSRLTALRSIEMDGCTGREIDVTRWDLDTLTVTGRTELRWINANEGTSVNCPAPGLRRKVCVNVYCEGKLIGQTAAGSRRYIKVPARRDINHNGTIPMRNGQLAFCQSITTWWLGARAKRHADKRSGAIDRASDMYGPLQNRKSFRRAVTGDMEKQYDRALIHARRNIMVGNDRFGEMIKKEFLQMRRGGIPAMKLFQVNSIDHAMGLELKVKNGRDGKPEYSLVLYDPNVSTTHVRTKYHRASEARELTLTGLFIDQNVIPIYFEGQAPVVTLVDLDSVQPGKKRSLDMMLSNREKRSTLTLNLAIRDGFDAAAETLIDDLRTMKDEPVDWKAILLAVTKLKDLPLFILAIEAERPRLAGVLADVAIDLIVEGTFKRATLFDFLQQEGSRGDVAYTALGLACEVDDRNFIGQLIDVLVLPKADGLANRAEYEDLLRNGGRGQPSPYGRAIRCGHINAAQSMVEGMLRLAGANRITCDQVVDLLACRSGSGVQTIEKAFKEDNAALMKAVMEPLTSSATAAFSATQLIAMLAAAGGNGTPALRSTYEAGHAEFLAAYGKLVLSAVSRDRIRPLDAIVLLTAARPEETPCEAIRAMAPAGAMLRTLDSLLHDVRVARWLPDDLSEAVDALLTDDPAATLSSDFDTDSESSSLG